jgi:predicted phosphodiesterase
VSQESKEPDELADRYQATRNLKLVVSELKSQLDQTTPYVFEYHERIEGLSQELGRAQNERGDLDMPEYREEFPELPTLKTWGKHLFLPTDSEGDRLPLVPNSEEELEYAMEELRRFREYLPPESVKILHVADTHLGFGRRYKSEVNLEHPPWSVFCAWSFQKVVEIAKEEEVDAVVHAGDIFDESPGEEHVWSFERAVEELDEADIQFVFILGNHEVRIPGRGCTNATAKLIQMADAGKVNLLSDKAYTLGSGSDTEDEIVAIYGVNSSNLGTDDWESGEDEWRSWNTKLPESFHLKENSATHNILCYHGAFTEDGNYPPATEFVERFNLSFDKLLLGHKHDSMDGVEGCEYAHYSGATQRLREKESPSVGVNIFEFYDDGSIEKEWMSIGSPE